MIPKSWRTRFFNWLGAGKITLTVDKPQEYSMANTYTIGGAGSMNYNPGLGGLTINPSAPQTSQTMTVKITPANGGTIVQMQTSDYGTGELHIIPNGTDFDRELGKIITMSKLKS
jgi:hypothetical protein